MSDALKSADRLGTVARVGELLKAVAEQDADFSIQQMSTTLGLPASTTHRLLQLLIDQNLVAPSTTPHLYTIGMELYRIGALISRKTQIATVAASYLRNVVQACGEACLLGVYLPAQRSMMFAAAEQGLHPLQYRVVLHEPLSVYWGASGQAILAHLPDSEVERIRAEAEASPTLGIAPLSKAKMNARLAQTRERGYGMTTGEKLPDAIGMAAPVFAAGNVVIGDLCVTVPRSRFKPKMEKDIARVLIAEAHGLSRALGMDERAAAVAPGPASKRARVR